MTDDLVARLQNAQTYGISIGDDYLCKDAADAIERLRAEQGNLLGDRTLLQNALWQERERAERAEAGRVAAIELWNECGTELQRVEAERDALKALLDQVTEKWIEDADPRECPELCEQLRVATGVISQSRIDAALREGVK